MNSQSLKEICEGLPPIGHYFLWALLLVAHFIRLHFVKKKIIGKFLEQTVEEQMEVMKGVTVGLEKGDIVIRVSVLAEVEKIEAKVQSGEIDLVKGTDLDKTAVLLILSKIKEELSK